MKHDYNRDRKTFYHYCELHDGVLLNNIIDSFGGVIPEDAYIDIDHSNSYYSVCDLTLSVKWTVDETDEEYELRMKDYEVEVERKAKETKKQKAKLKLQKEKNKEIEREKEIALLAELKAKYPDV